MASPKEIAAIVVNGKSFEDWTSVTVSKDYSAPADLFTFTATEDTEDMNGLTKLSWANLKLKPGDQCEITLGRKKVTTGAIEARQVSHNARTHGVQLSGRSKLGDIVDSSADVDTGQFKGYRFDAIAKRVLKPYSGITLKMKGDPGEKFPDVNIHYGETVFQFLERLARQRKLHLRGDEDGNLVAGDDDKENEKSVAQLEVGRNILWARGTIRDDFSFQYSKAVGQERGTDEKHGDAVRNLAAKVTNEGVKRYRNLLVIGEEAGDEKQLVDRLARELQEQHATSVDYECGVQGWFKPDGNLWKEGEQVTVKDPLVFANSSGQMDLAVQAVTFTQDSGQGTMTVLSCVILPALRARFPTGPQGEQANPFKPAKMEPKPASDDEKDGEVST